MGVPRKLTSKQILFVKELVHNEGKITATEAAINAGYPEATARSKASMLQNPKYYPLVVDYARQVREEVQQKYKYWYFMLDTTSSSFLKIITPYIVPQHIVSSIL